MIIQPEITLTKEQVQAITKRAQKIFLTQASGIENAEEMRYFTSTVLAMNNMIMRGIAGHEFTEELLQKAIEKKDVVLTEFSHTERIH